MIDVKCQFIGCPDFGDSNFGEATCPDWHATCPIPGTLYQHWKGSIYMVTGVATDRTNGQLRYLVLYVQVNPVDEVHELGLNAREIGEWNDIIHTEDGSVCQQEKCFRSVGSKFAPRFRELKP